MISVENAKATCVGKRHRRIHHQVLGSRAKYIRSHKLSFYHLFLSSKSFISLSMRSLAIISTTHIIINHRNGRFNKNNCATLYTFN